MRVLLTVAIASLVLCTDLPTGFAHGSINTRVAVSSAGRSVTSTGKTGALAFQNALDAYPSNGRVLCTEQNAVCDDMASVEPTEGTTSLEPDFLGFLRPPFWRGLQVAVGSVYLTALILIALFLWVFASVVSSAPIDVLKRKLVVSAWIVLPAALTHTLWLTVPGSFQKNDVHAKCFNALVD